MEQVWQSLKNMALGWGVPSVWIGPVFGLLAGGLILVAGLFLVSGIPENTAIPVLPTPTDVFSETPTEVPGDLPSTPITGTPALTPVATPDAPTSLTATPVPPLPTPTEIGTATPVPPTPTPEPTATATPTPTPTPVPLVGRPMNAGQVSEREFREGNMETFLLFDYTETECVLLANITEFADDGFALGTKSQSFTDTLCDGSVDVLFGDQYNEREPENEELFIQWDKEYEVWLTKMELWEWIKVTDLSP
jgi:hypothetical protein